ncbi:MAG: hypothetical protein K1X38_11940 [Microthrixaceae bacterium]|nr:hypothetical protein [Microthrixaceae bacterium]
MKHRVVALAVAATVLIVPACKFAKVGGRCAAAQGPARTATHVLFCVDGRWKQTLTIGQAADFIIGQWPGSATSSAGNDIYSSPFSRLPEFDLTVTNRAGKPAANTTVTLSLTGPGISGAHRSEFRTDARGIFRFVQPHPLIVGPLGVYTLTWSGPHPTPILTQRIHKAGRPASVALLSGDNQTITAGQQLAPFEFEVRDSNGVPVKGARVKLELSEGLEIVSATNGLVVVRGTGRTDAGRSTVRLVAYEPAPLGGDWALGTATASYTVNAGPIDDALIYGDLQSANTGAGFSYPLSVRPIDAYGNSVRNAVTFTVVPGASGASGAISPAGTNTVTATANEIAGDWGVRADIAGLGSFVFELENL